MNAFDVKYIHNFLISGNNFTTLAIEKKKFIIMFFFKVHTKRNIKKVEHTYFAYSRIFFTPQNKKR